MNINDLIDAEYTQEQIEEQMVNQGFMVLQIISSPGWQVILSTLAAVKNNIEEERANGLRNMTNGDRALYFSGKVDGFKQAISEINNIVKMAGDVKKNRAIRKQSEAE